MAINLIGNGMLLYKHNAITTPSNKIQTARFINHVSVTI